VVFSLASYRRYVAKCDSPAELARRNPWTPAIRLRLIANQKRHMENQKTKGRPPKQKGTVKREHFSVWVSADQKTQINQIIEKSGLSASQYFLTLALDVPFKKPQKRSLPKQVADTVRILEQLSGILSLAVLKTKDQQMLSAQWQQSSQRVRLLADLITLWVFESFEIRSIKQTLGSLRSWLNELTNFLSLFPDELESKQEIAGLLDSAREGSATRIFIGSENKLFSLSGSSVIAAPYRGSDGRVVGVVGVIGPTRLNYARIVPMVDFTAQSLSRLIR